MKSKSNLLRILEKPDASELIKRCDAYIAELTVLESADLNKWLEEVKPIAAAIKTLNKAPQPLRDKLLADLIIRRDCIYGYIYYKQPLDTKKFNPQLAMNYFERVVFNKIANTFPTAFGCRHLLMSLYQNLDKPKKILDYMKHITDRSPMEEAVIIKYLRSQNEQIKSQVDFIYKQSENIINKLYHPPINFEAIHADIKKLVAIFSKLKKASDFFKNHIPVDERIIQDFKIRIAYIQGYTYVKTPAEGKEKIVNNRKAALFLKQVHELTLAHPDIDFPARDFSNRLLFTVCFSLNEKSEIIRLSNEIKNKSKETSLIVSSAKLYKQLILQSENAETDNAIETVNKLIPLYKKIGMNVHGKVLISHINIIDLKFIKIKSKKYRSYALLDSVYSSFLDFKFVLDTWPRRIELPEIARVKMLGVIDGRQTEAFYASMMERHKNKKPEIKIRNINKILRMIDIQRKLVNFISDHKLHDEVFFKSSEEFNNAQYKKYERELGAEEKNLALQNKRDEEILRKVENYNNDIKTIDKEIEKIEKKPRYARHLEYYKKQELAKQKKSKKAKRKARRTSSRTQGKSVSTTSSPSRTQVPPPPKLSKYHKAYAVAYEDFKTGKYKNLIHKSLPIALDLSERFKQSLWVVRCNGLLAETYFATAMNILTQPDLSSIEINGLIAQAWTVLKIAVNILQENKKSIVPKDWENSKKSLDLIAKYFKSKIQKINSLNAKRLKVHNRHYEQSTQRFHRVLERNGKHGDLNNPSKRSLERKALKAKCRRYAKKAALLSSLEMASDQAFKETLNTESNATTIGTIFKYAQRKEKHLYKKSLEQYRIGVYKKLSDFKNALLHNKSFIVSEGETFDTSDVFSPVPIISTMSFRADRNPTQLSFLSGITAPLLPTVDPSSPAVTHPAKNAVKLYRLPAHNSRFAIAPQPTGGLVKIADFTRSATVAELDEKMRLLYTEGTLIGSSQP